MPISGKKVIKKLKKLGWEIISQRGSHVKLRNKEGILVIIPVHGGKDLPKGTLKSIERQTKENIL